MKKVMIVDDAAFMRTSIKVMLEHEDYEVVAEAANGEEAIEMYLAHKPDIVTMDITMPIMDGIDAVKAIKKSDSNAKVIMVSAMGQEGLIRESIMAGATSFIVKPFKKDKLLEVLNATLK